MTFWKDKQEIIDQIFRAIKSRKCWIKSESDYYAFESIMGLLLGGSQQH